MIDPEIRRYLDDLRAGRIGSAGEVALSLTPATSTTVTTQAASSSSVVLLSPLDANAATLGIPRVVPANGSFTITHAASAGVRTYRYAVLTPTN